MAGAAIASSGSAPSQAPDPREVQQLRMELSTATAYVRSLTEQLKESHEEAQASMEEFRSTNEELQTTKEEIESTNEELTTINEELRAANQDIAKSAAALRASGAFTSAIVQTMRYPLLVLNPDLSVESVNQAFLDTFGVERQKTIGRLVYDLGNGQWNIPELRRLLEDILPNNSAFDDFEVTHDFASIGHRTMLLNARGLHGEDDRLRLIVLVIADVTERSRIANDLKMKADELRRSNDELDQFAAIAAHDLQEPLRMISSYMDLLREQYGTQFDDRSRNYMGKITDGARRMSTMMHAILAFSRLGHEAATMAPIDSTGPFRDAVANLAAKVQDADAVIYDLPLPLVMANREQLTQLFQNLISNALKYRSEERRAEVRVGAHQDGDKWVFAITDNGIGMDESDYSKIFLLFQRLPTERDVSGCGIGLAICKKIIEHHAGRIWVKSQKGVGSTFYFTLPNVA
jgi:two-component system CheB/CheR fusion protein